MKNRPLHERLGFAAAGLRAGFARERSFRTHCLCATLAFGALLVLRPPPIWWAAVTLTCAAVMTLELVNSALEGVIDLLHPELHAEIKVIKDMLAGAVLIASIAALAVAAALAVDSAPRLLVLAGIIR